MWKGTKTFDTHSCIVQLDGYMARKMGINSVVGSYLDPLADKVNISFFFSFFLTLG